MVADIYGYYVLLGGKNPVLVLYIALTWPEHVVFFLFAVVVADVAISVAETHETREIHSCLQKGPSINYGALSKAGAGKPVILLMNSMPLGSDDFNNFDIFNNFNDFEDFDNFDDFDDFNDINFDEWPKRKITVA